jgi:hypothetical protein
MAEWMTPLAFVGLALNAMGLCISVSCGAVALSRGWPVTVYVVTAMVHVTFLVLVTLSLVARATHVS